MNTRNTRTKAGRIQVRPARAVGYVRVSRVAGRAGESFIAPDVQRDAIAAKVAASGLELVGLEEDLDVSGRTLERPGFQRALELVERGEASVIVVAKLTRFARSVSGTMRALDRLEAAGGRLVACDVDVDVTTPAGRLTRTILASIAEFESEVIRESWAAAHAHAIDRGVKISHTANLGYRFGDGHRLEVVEEERGLVVELFERRAAGASWSELDELLVERGVELSRSTVIRSLRNRVYLGEASFGELVNVEAHEPLVAVAVFDAVQARFAAGRERHARYDRAVRSLLAGIARCGSCGSRMRRGPAGQQKVGMYACRNRDCTARASLTEERLDAFVESQLFEWAGGAADELVEVTVGGEGSRRRELEARLAELELALEGFVTAPDGFGLEPAVFRAGVDARQAAVDATRVELGELDDVDEAVDVRTTLRQVWPELETSERRRLVDVVVDRIIVERGTMRGRARDLEPVADRVRIILRDGSSI